MDRLAFRRIFEQIHQFHRLSMEERTLSRLTSLVVALGLRSGLFSDVTFEGATPRRVGHERERVRRLQNRAENSQDLQDGRTLCLNAIRAFQHTRSRSHQRVSHTRQISASKISWFDMMPDFLVLSARISASLDQKVSRQWMDLAALFMFHAALEQYVHKMNEALDLSELDAAFAWGWVDDDPRPLTERNGVLNGVESSDDEDLNEINEIFRSADQDAEIEGWQAIRLRYKARFLAIGNKRWEEHLDELTKEFPVRRFGTTLLEYLDNLFAQIQKRPVLVQLEDGELHGLSKSKTANLLQRAFATR